MRPSEILDAQGELLDRLQHNPLFRKHQAIAAAWALGLDGEAGRLEAAQPGTVHHTAGAEAWVDALRNHVKAAHAYRVTPDMCLMLEHAANALDETDTFERDLAPTGCGIVRFERPIHVRDVRGRKMLVHWAIWGPAQVRRGRGRNGAKLVHGDYGEPGLALSFFNDAWSEPDSTYADYEAWVETTGDQQATKDARATYELAMRAIGRWMSSHQTGIASGDPLGPSELEATQEQQAVVLGGGGEPQAATNLIRYMHALFLLLNQTLVETEDEHPDRHARKRAIKAGLPPKVTVIRLRRSESSVRREGESLVEWSHRWIVRQHWRWQPYGPRKNQDHEHDYGPIFADQGSLVRHCTHYGCHNYVARIMIHEAVKGPPDAPLIVSDKLYSLER